MAISDKIPDMPSYLPTLEDLIRAHDALPLREGRYADLMIETKDGRVLIRDLTIDRDGAVLLVPVIPLKQS